MLKIITEEGTVVGYSNYCYSINENTIRLIIKNPEWKGGKNRFQQIIFNFEKMSCRKKHSFEEFSVSLYVEEICIKSQERNNKYLPGWQPCQPFQLESLVDSEFVEMCMKGISQCRKN